MRAGIVTAWWQASNCWTRFRPTPTMQPMFALQTDMERLLLPEDDAAWVHKYFHLICPAKLDDFHNPDYQRYHLIKLLQLPPAGKGRYIAAGRYVAIARDLDMPMNHLTSVLVHRNGSPHRYWRIGTSSDGKHPRNRWALMRDGDLVAVGWPNIGDLSQIEDNRAGKEAVRSLMAAQYPSIPQYVGVETQEVFNFVTVPEGEYVLASDGAAVLGIGKITGPYAYDASSDFPHRRRVAWLSLEEWKLPQAEALRSTFRQLKADENLIETERRLCNQRMIIPSEAGKKPAPALQLTGIPGRIQSVLERKRQVILYGPPGTGKTYWALLAARDLAAHAAFGSPFAGLSAEQQAAITGDQGAASGIVRTCSFHPAYGYEDFLEGYRPLALDGQLAFERRDGIFKRLCQDARLQPECQFYLVIDEINRGDIPRIFGELLTVLEKDKRNRPILLPLSGTPFAVPDNVFVIATMNTADRSIALLDTALRRRFGFVELMPDSSVLGGAAPGGVPLGPWLDALNRNICEHIGRDARNLQVGHADPSRGRPPCE